MFEERKGNYGRPGNKYDKFRQLPKDVRDRVDEFQSNLDDDWILFVSQIDKQMWIIHRIWIDEGTFEVVASMVKYQSEEINV
jgi:hypothetical protein